MEAYEDHDVFVVYIPDAFLQTKASDVIMIKFQGAVVEAVLRINPSWKQYIVHEVKSNVSTIYSEVIKARCGTVGTFRLFLEDLTSFLVKELCFTANPYNTCVINKDIDGKKCTISWHVGNLKTSHKNTKVVTSIIKSLSNKYGITMPLSIGQGKLHEYLGMTFDFSNIG